MGLIHIGGLKILNIKLKYYIVNHYIIMVDQNTILELIKLRSNARRKNLGSNTKAIRNLRKKMARENIVVG
ncbi:Ribosomal protein L29 [Candidatus Nanobsidianus stetteri]|uniref:Ribosomal protein L29 n=1 Tax=Nanobsidianus stetteri TaxID=1294122 RepID=R1E3S5_NANST|nr:Ribosomal protein L29 [Candidatus Nanobsidianus stetteri]